MKEEILDKYVGKIVCVTDCNGDKDFGEFHKIIDGKACGMIMCFNNGYYLDGVFKGVTYRKSHIKKIVEAKDK